MNKLRKLSRSVSFESSHNQISLNESDETLFNKSFSFNEFRFNKSSSFNESLFNKSLLSFNEHSLLSHIDQSKKSSNQAIESNQLIRSDTIKRESDFERELSILTKLYTNEAKYSDENDSFLYKLIIFHDMCDRADIFHLIKLKVFFIMLKGLTLDYYYENMITSITSSTFDEICFQIKSYFEDVEYKKSLLSK